ncbi:MAG: ATP-binding protein, partial [Phycicoccus sp.]
AALRHPLTEPVVELSMRALWATGRTADAVQRYHRLRALLRRELGTDPAPPVAELFASIVRDHPAPARGGDPGASVRPAQLPIDLSGFSGRDAELGRLDGLLDDGGPSRVAPLIGVVTGPAGVGKTALAVRWAHRVSHRFPDGQLYGDLRGVDPGGPVDAYEVVRGFLAALGVPARQIPAAPQAQVGLYRSVVAGRRVLVVLDDAASADQVRPLLPNSPDAGVVVTSRRRLTPLVVAEGARPLQLDLLGDDDAERLLAGRIGDDVAGWDDEALARVARRCSGLPLALAIVAARVRQTGFEPAAIEHELGDPLAALDSHDPSTGGIRTVFDVSYARLSDPAARAVRLVGLLAGPDITAAAAASLTGLSSSDARRAVAELLEANLVTEYRPGRYRMHDLLRAYAARLAREAEPAPAIVAAERRLLDHYLHTADVANRLLHRHELDPLPLGEPAPGACPQPLGHEAAARDWLHSEKHALVAALRRAASAGDSTRSWHLAHGLSFLHDVGDWHTVVEAWHVVLDQARPGEPSAVAHAHRILGRAYTRLGRCDTAARQFAAALREYTRVGDRRGLAATHSALCCLWDERGRWHRSLSQSRRALALFEEVGDRHGRAVALGNVAWYSSMVGRHTAAVEFGRLSLDVFVEDGDRLGAAGAWDTLGRAHQGLGDHAEAVRCFETAIEIVRTLGAHALEATGLDHLGDAAAAAHDLRAARDAWSVALRILEDLSHPDAGTVRAKLAGLDVGQVQVGA